MVSNISMQAPKKDGPFEIVIASETAEARRAQDEIEGYLQEHFADADLFGIRLALEEAIINAIKHGNQMDPAKRVFIRYCVEGTAFHATIIDEGPGFNLDDVPDPLSVENLERPCGRGLLLIRHYMTEVSYTAPGNRLTMRKVCQPLRRNGCRVV